MGIRRVERFLLGGQFSFRTRPLQFDAAPDHHQMHLAAPEIIEPQQRPKLPSRHVVDANVNWRHATRSVLLFATSSSFHFSAAAPGDLPAGQAHVSGGNRTV